MWASLSEMLSRMTLIVTIASLITRLSIFRQMINHNLSMAGRFVLILLFGISGIIGNYTAIVVNPEAHIISNVWNPELQMDNAIADTRNIGIIIGGFLGGPRVRIGAYVIACGGRLLVRDDISEASYFR